MLGARVNEEEDSTGAVEDAAADDDDDCSPAVAAPKSLDSMIVSQPLLPKLCVQVCYTGEQTDGACSFPGPEHEQTRLLPSTQTAE